MAAKRDVNSEDYWDNRFGTDWESNAGDQQSVFFANLAFEMLPEWFKEYFKKQKLTFCDWGCAEGDGTNVIASQFPNNKFTGIDFADTAIQKAQAKFQKVNFEAVDLLTEKYNQHYDAIFASNVFEHFHNPWETFHKVSKFADDFFIIMVPFDEDPNARIPEHFASFSLENIPIEFEGWSLVHLAVRNTEVMPNTYWAGKQALMIFTKPNVKERLNLKIVDISLYTNDVVAKEEQIEMLISEIKRREEHIKDMDAELRQNWLLLNSRRYRAASKVADAANVLVPAKSLRRKALVTPVKGVQQIAKVQIAMRDAQFNKEMFQLAQEHSAVIVHSGMPWNAIMRQRPHHITEQLASLGYMMVYIDPEAEQSYKVSDDLVIVSGYKCLDVLSPLRNRTNLYYLSSAGFPSSFTELKSIVDRGFKIIYEYIDELDESISGDLSKQLEVFNRLEELDPVLLLASAKRLYDQLAARFSEERVLLNENGVDDKQFAPTKRSARNAPDDMQPIISKGKPIVGYYGALAPWLDYDLINKMTATKRDYEFVFIGIDYNGGLRHLARRSNVHYLGGKDYNKLADYSYWFDCALIPFETGEIAKSTSPLKLFEYMAMGLPTVCTRDLRECSGYEGVLMSKDTDEFMRNVDKAIKLKQTPKARQILIDNAKKNTWKVRAKDVVDRLAKLEAIKE